MVPKIDNELTAFYGQDVVSYRTVAHWINRLFSGRESLDDGPRQGRLIAVITQQNIDAVADVIHIFVLLTY